MPVNIIWCPSCRGRVRFDIRKQKFACERCDATYSLTELDASLPDAAAKEASDELWESVAETTGSTLAGAIHEAYAEDEQGGQAQAYACPNCGAQVLVEAKDASAACPFCETYVAVPERLLADAHAPKRVLPFKVSREEAQAAFADFTRRKPLLPKAFQKIRPEAFRGVYAPYWLYSSACQGALDAECDQVSTWSDDDYNYIKTDTYRVRRAGEMAFRDVPYDASSQFNAALLHGIEPYKNEALEPFSIEYLLGYAAACPDTPSEKLVPQYRTMAGEVLEKNLISTMRGYSAVRVRDRRMHIDDVDSEYVVYPLWLLTIPYRNRNWVFAINGQTGRIAGSLPASGARALRWFVALAGATAAIGFLMMEVGIWMGW